MNALLLSTVLSIFLALGTPHAPMADPVNSDQSQQQTDTTVIYTCPMHPEIVSDKPGKCPKCGMALVPKEVKVKAPGDNLGKVSRTPAEKLREARKLLDEAKKELSQDGKYNCCIDHMCDRCALDHGSCPCGDAVKRGKPVCPDCYAGWQRGDGIVQGVNPKKVKMSTHGHAH